MTEHGFVIVKNTSYPATRDADGAVRRCINDEGDGRWINTRDQKIIGSFRMVTLVR